MKEMCKKISNILKMIFGYGIVITLFAGGLTFFGYLAALVIGGEAATLICTIIYEKIIPVIIYASTSLVLLGLLSMYMAGETALTMDKEKQSEYEGEL